MKKLWILTLTAALALGLCACGASQPEAAPTEGAAVEDGALTVRLEGNPTTGYEWSWTLDGGDILAGAEPDYLSSDTTGLLDGAGGLYTFRFTPVRAGAATLRFSYARSWETVEPLEERAYAVTVTQAADGTLSISLD